VFRLTDLRANRRVRTDQHALSTFDAEVGFPHRDFLSDVALLPLRRRDRVSAVKRERADRQVIALATKNFHRDVANEIGHLSLRVSVRTLCLCGDRSVSLLTTEALRTTETRRDFGGN